MAILFSEATLASEGSNTSFLIAGAPSTAEGFDGWTAYHSFVYTLPAGTEVQAHITAYTYSERDVVVATPYGHADQDEARFPRKPLPDVC